MRSLDPRLTFALGILFALPFPGGAAVAEDGQQAAKPIDAEEEIDRALKELDEVLKAAKTPEQARPLRARKRHGTTADAVQAQPEPKRMELLNSDQTTTTLSAPDEPPAE